MRHCGTWACVAVALASFAFAQQAPTKAKTEQGKKSSRASAQPDVKDIVESKVKAEWDAFKKKDKKAYSDLLADDFVAVEDDGEGERNKIHAVNEIDASNIYNYLNRYKRVLVGELWLKRGGQWKERHYQETRVK